MSKRIAVLLSGGVDSSVALWKLKEAGYKDITAYYLKIWLEDELSYLGSCPWEEDLSYARDVCRQADVPLEVVPLQMEYFDRVVEYALAELRRGRTPSPDIFCNQRIKFGAFLDAVDGSITDVASGHYARRESGPGGSVLMRSPDPVKDQTYFLSHLSQEQLSRILFPIGTMEKYEVREMAERLDLPNKDRRDSQGICFLGKIRYPDFVRHYLGEQPGDIVEAESGKILGTHRGFWFHTTGQREGLGLGNGPWYVVKKDTQANIVYVSHRNNVADSARKRFRVGELNWINGAPSRADLTLKIRHGPQLHRCSVTPCEASGGAEHMEVEMETADRGVAPGQFAVFYDDQVCLGGGKILEDEVLTRGA